MTKLTKLPVGVQPQITPQELVEAEEVIRSDAKVIELAAAVGKDPLEGRNKSRNHIQESMRINFMPMVGRSDMTPGSINRLGCNSACSMPDMERTKTCMPIHL